MGKVLVLAYERSHVDKLLSSAVDHSKTDDVVVVTMGVPQPNTEFVCRDFQYYLSKNYEKNATKKVQSWIRDWSSKKLINGKTFKDLICYEGVSLWWFIEYYYFYSLYMFNIAKQIEILKSVAVKENPTKVLFIKDESLSTNVLESFLKANNIELIEIPNDPSLQKRTKTFFSNFVYEQARKRWKFLLNIKETLRSNWINFLNRVLSNKSKKLGELPTVVMIMSEGFWSSIVDSKTGLTKKGFRLTDAIVKKLSDQYRLTLVSFDSFFTKFLGLRLLFEEKRTYGHTIIKTPENWENKKVKQKVKQAKMSLDKTWENLKSLEVFHSSLTYDNVPLWSILQEMFSGIFSMELPEAVRWIETMKVLIDSEKPESIVIPGEYCSFLGYSAMIAGNQKNVPTIAIQHGVVTQNSLDYAMKISTKDEDSINSRMWIVPTKLAVYGDYSKKVLESLSYPSNNIAITGHPDYDVLVKLKRVLDKTEILEELGLSANNKKIITFTTQPLWSIKSREKLFRAVLNTVKNLEDVILLIKPHPVEDENWHKNLVKEMGAENTVVISPNYCTAKALFVCDLMITSFSTTAMEAMILDKPVITVELEDETENFPYAESGATVGVFNPNDLLPAINNVFTNETVRSNLEENRKKFLSEHIYKADGNSSERIVNLVSEFVRSKNTT